MLQQLKRANIVEKIGKEHIYLSVADAVTAAAAADANLSPTPSKPSPSDSGTLDRNSSDGGSTDKPNGAASPALV